MRKGGFHDFAGVVGLLGRPVPKGRPEPMRHGADLQLPEQLREDHVGERRPADPREDEPLAVQRLCRVENLRGPLRQRHPVFARPSCAWPENRPHPAVPVDLVPRREPHLARPRGGQYQKLKGELDHAHGTRPLHRRDLGMGQRPHVLHDDLLAAQRWPDPVARVVNV